MRSILLAVSFVISLVTNVQAQQMITVDFSTGQLWHLYGEGQRDVYQVVLPKQHVQQEMNLSRPVLGTFTQADYKPTWWPTASMRAMKPALPKAVQFGQSGHPIGIYRLRIAWHNPPDAAFWAPVRIHGGAKDRDLNNAESAGCIRMRDAEIQKLVRNMQQAMQKGESSVIVSFGFFS